MHYRLHGGYHDGTALCVRLLFRKHEATQSCAADVIYGREVQYYALAMLLAPFDERINFAAEVFAIGVINPPLRRKHKNITVNPILNFHSVVPTIVIRRPRIDIGDARFSTPSQKHGRSRENVL